MWWLAGLAVAGATEIGNGRNFGLGIQLGSFSGLSGKVYTNGRTNAVDFVVGSPYYGRGYGGIYAHGSYHWALASLTEGGGVSIPFRVGVGGFLLSDRYYWYDGDYAGDFVVGARVPFGLDFDLDSAPLQFWVEVAPEITVLPPLLVYFDASVGFRYYF